MEDKRQQEVTYGKEQQVLSDMKRFREIIQDNTAPSTSDLWINKGKLKYFDGGWKDLGREQVLWDDIQEKPEFATVATTGSYNDLSDKPTIPSAYTLPDATALLRGGVLMGAAVPDITIDGTETASTVATTVNALLASLRAAGMLNS